MLNTGVSRDEYGIEHVTVTGRGGWVVLLFLNVTHTAITGSLETGI